MLVLFASAEVKMDLVKVTKGKIAAGIIFY